MTVESTGSGRHRVVVVGGGTVGAWTAVLLAESGVENVVLLEASTLGDGASSRAAGMVRAQGGTEPAIKLGLRTQEFYRSTGDRFPFDCGFVAQGYLPAVLGRPGLPKSRVYELGFFVSAAACKGDTLSL